jgi:hypothetical protein
MIDKDFKIDFERKIITHTGRVKKVCPANELYSYIMDLFDEPENMRYDIPIVAVSKTEFNLVNGWTIDKDSLKFIKGKISTP